MIWLMAFILASMGAAIVFRRLIAGPKGRLGTILSYTVVPMSAAFLACWIACVLSYAMSPNQTQNALSDVVMNLFIFTPYGIGYVFVRYWYVVLLMSMASQVVMHASGRRLLGIRVVCQGVRSEEDVAR